MNILQILVPSYCQQEISYIIQLLLFNFFGMSYQLTVTDNDAIVLQSEGRRLSLPATFFSCTNQHWLASQSLPLQPLTIWDSRQLGLVIKLLDEKIPVIYGTASCKKDDDEIKLGLDLFGSAFFMLSRYEEAVKPDRDNYDRFPATASLAYQEGFLHRPIVNEYLEILWACMKHLWPGLKRKKRDFQMRVTADVDQPYACGIKNPVRQIKQIGGDLLKRRDPIRAVRSGINYFTTKWGNFSFDPYYCRFDWMMDINEVAGNKMAFYFMAGHSDTKMDGCYSLDEPIIRKLMRRIHKRGHEIGLHSSYNTYRNPDQLHLEANNLRRVMEEEGIQQDEIGGRQHYLRWVTPTTACYLDSAGLDYDSTLSFADHTGFRCGTCYEYTYYDVIQRKALKLKERPLVVMEVSLSAQYTNLGYSHEALGVIKYYLDSCKKFDGDFVLLWHNSSFETHTQREVYTNILGILTNK